MIANLKMQLQHSKQVQSLPFGFNQDMPSEDELKERLLIEVFEYAFWASVDFYHFLEPMKQF